MSVGPWVGLDTEQGPSLPRARGPDVAPRWLSLCALSLSLSLSPPTPSFLDVISMQ